VAALEVADAAVACTVHGAPAHFVRGCALQVLSRREDALSAFDSALALHPDHVDALRERARTLQGLGRHLQSLEDVEILLSVQPEKVGVLLIKAKSLTGLGRLNQAVQTLDKALDRTPPASPERIEVLFHKGIALHQLGRFDQALACFDDLLQADPDHLLAHYNRAGAYRERGNLTLSIEDLDWVLKRQPDFVDARVNRSVVRLLAGDLAGGLADYQARWKRSAQPIDRLVTAAIPSWTGEPLQGRRIVVYGEQGQGDTIQFCRFVARLGALGGRVTLCVPERLHGLLSSLDRPYPMVCTVTDAAEFDFQISLMDLPHVLGLSLGDVVPDGPYLAAEPDRVDHWRQLLGTEGFKIGIAWQGNPMHTANKDRSPPLAVFRPLASVENVRLISLQKLHGTDQMNTLPTGMAVEIPPAPFDEGSDGFLDTAAVMQAVDLVVTSDTAIAHLAGALGRPLWLALPRLADWRWMLDRTDSPWYPTARLFRQPRRGDWRSVFVEMARALDTEQGPSI